MSNETSDETPTVSQNGEAQAQWRAERTTFQRVYDVITGITDYTTATALSERADCSADGARSALSQLVEMGIAEQRGNRPTEYRRNESYFRWKRVETVARDYSVAELREQIDTLLEKDQAWSDRFDAPDPDSISPALFEDIEHETIHERWEGLTRWRSVRRDLKILQHAIHRAEQDTEGHTGAPA